jgi:hypothetical protein
MIHCSFQYHTEIEPSFLENYGNRFEDTWDIVNQDGSIIKLYIRNNIYNPTIANGWKQLKNYYHLTQNVQVHFDYFGGNLFKIADFNIIENLDTIPSFHSRSTIPNETKCFDFQLSKRDLDRSTLVRPLYTFIFNLFQI